jgi:phytanoyl-CoA hydroxylase
MKAAKEPDWFRERPWIDADDADVDRYVQGLEEDPGFDLATVLRSWKTNGYVIFEGVVDKQLIDALDEDIVYLKRHFRDFELFAELRGEQKALQDFREDELDLDGVKFISIQTISRAAALLSMTREVAVFLRHVFRSPAVVMQSLTFWKGSQQPIHIDYPYVRCQNILAHLAASWIPLEDIHPDSGPLAYYPGSHRIDVSGFFDWGGGSILYEPDSVRTPVQFAAFLAEQMRRSSVEPKVFCPKKGDVLIWHANLAHEGTPIRDPSRTRKSYVTHYTSLAAYPTEHMKPDALERGAYQSAHGAFCFDFPWLKQANKLPSHFVDWISHA